MSVLTSASHHRPVPIVASLAVAAVIAGGTALGIAWNDSGDSAAPGDAPSLRTPTWQDSTKYDYYHGSNAPGAPSFEPPASGGRVQVGQ